MYHVSSSDKKPFHVHKVIIHDTEPKYSNSISYNLSFSLSHSLITTQTTLTLPAGLRSNALRRLRDAILSTQRVIPSLAGVLRLAADTALNRIILVSDLLADVVLDGLGVRVVGADTLEAGALLLALAGVHAVQLTVRLALQRLAVLVGVVDRLAGGARVRVHGAGLGGRVAVFGLTGRGVDRACVVGVLLRSGTRGEGLGAELGEGFVAYLLAKLVLFSRESMC